MRTAEEIRDGMSQFYGTQTYTRLSPLFPKVLLTEGARYIAIECGAYWLMDMIASHTKAVSDGFAVVELLKNGDEATLIIADDKPPTRVYAKQHIGYTNFPLDALTLYIQYDGEHWVVMLPSEY